MLRSPRSARLEAWATSESALRDDRAGRDGMRHPALDMRDQDRARGARVAGQRAIEQGVMLAGGDRAAIAEREHLIADIAVEHGRVGLDQGFGAARGDQALMELPV